MNNDIYFNTKYVAEMFDKNIAAVLKYARTSNNILKKGDGKNTRYYWTESNIEEYKTYLEGIKNHTNYKTHHHFKETDKIDTLYKRLNRALKRNETELADSIRLDIQKLKNKI